METQDLIKTYFELAEKLRVVEAEVENLKEQRSEIAKEILGKSGLKYLTHEGQEYLVVCQGDTVFIRRAKPKHVKNPEEVR